MSKGLTNLVFWQNPAQSSNSRWCAYDAMQAYLTNLYQSNGSSCDVDYVVVQVIFVCIDKKRIFSRCCDKHNGRRQFLNVHYMAVVERCFA